MDPRVIIGVIWVILGFMFVISGIAEVIKAGKLSVSSIYYILAGAIILIFQYFIYKRTGKVGGFCCMYDDACSFNPENTDKKSKK